MKKRGMKKRVLAALMTACMVVGSVPGVSLADVSGETAPNLSGTLTPDAKKYNFNGSASTEANPDIELKKTAVYNAETNDYTITLSAKAQEKVETKKTHVVFLLDASGSMNFCSDNNIKEVNRKPNKKDEHVHYHYYDYEGLFSKKYVSGCTKIDKDSTRKSRWEIATEAIKSMTDELGSDNIDYDYTWFNDKNSQGDGTGSENPYSNVTPEEGTFLTEGVEHALGKFKNDASDTDKVMVIVADGETSNIVYDGLLDFVGHKYYPKEELKSFKSAPNNGKVYTVGFTFSSEGFKSLANGPDYNFNATDEDSLNVALNKISQKIKTGITDPLGNNVELVGDIKVDGSDAAAKYDSENNEITWNDPNGLDQNGVSLTYRVKVKDTSNAGSVDLNGDAVLSYTAGSENHTVEFPKPSITGAKLTVQYTEQGTEKVVKTDNDWIGFTGGNVSFKKITEIPKTILVDGTTYYVVSSDPEAIPTPTEAINYIVNVQVSKEKPTEAIYSVIYDANGGTWKEGYEAQESYTLNPERNMLTRAGMNYGDMIEILDGKDAPEKSGYVFKGWQLDEDKLVVRVPVGRAADSDHQVHLSAIWEKDGSSEENNITYSVNQHYIAPDHTDNVSIKDLTAGKDASIKDAISGYTQDLPWRGDTYLYRSTTVMTGGQTVDYNPDTARFTENTTIDIYYYRDSWNAGNNSETGGDGTPDTEQVLVKFGSKDRGDWVTGSGIVQVYTLDEGQTTVTPSKDNVTVSCDEGYHFTKWTKNNSENEIDPFTEQTGVKGGETINFWAWFAADEVKVPEKPESAELPYVTVICTNTNASHSVLERNYYILDEEIAEGRVIVGDVKYDSTCGNYVSHVKVMGAYYAGLFDVSEGGNHIATKANDVSFDMVWDGEKWIAPDSIDTIKISCAGSETQDPELPGFKELKDLSEGVVLVHTGSNAAAHPDEEYTLMEDGYEISWYGTTKAILTVKAAPYVNEYIAAHGNHDVKGAASAKLILARTDGGWDIKEGTTPIRFFVKCTENNPEKPALPEYDDLKKLFGETINVTCETDEQHAPQSFGLMAGTYSVTRDKENDNEAVVTVFAKDYIKAYGDGKHTNAGDDAATVKLFYDEEDGKWYSENQEIVINFKAKCEKTPETPEKQYTEIKFVVVNGTFTENGQTELTKTFEVGTKLTLADIPASKGKSSSYSDQTWDKFPVGYVVGKDGTTFTITYRWRSSGSDSDDSDYDYGTSTRGKATNAAGKSGRWILEGGEFTEDNGRLPSNEYLKIGDTIYGFYTYGFAIDFDRPEYYTDAAIQAKGGYRDATGTWRLNGWWFCYDDGTFPHDEWVYLTWNGRSDWYYFDVDGWMEDGWLYRNNNWYYLHTQYDNTRGHMYTGWHEIDGKWYYFNTASDKGTLGAMLANTTTPDGYQVDANGAWIR